MALLLLLATLAGSYYTRHHRKLSQKDALLVTDFVNLTADPVFDGTLRRALAFDLEQSPYLNVLPDSQVRETLALMGRPPAERITAEVGREICVRSGAKAVLNGSISNDGGQYHISLEALNAATGETLARGEAEAVSREQVLDALHRAGTKMRSRLGESLSSVKKFDQPLARATTSSLEALQAFTEGDAKHFQGLEMEAMKPFQRAIELDPNFALAYARLGTVYSNLYQSDLAEQCRQKAFELRDRASEREKLYIMGHYFTDSGQLDKGIQAWELYKSSYSNDALAYNNVSVLYERLGQFEYALENARQAVALDPQGSTPYIILANAYAGLNRLDEARATLRMLLQKYPSNWTAHVELAQLAWAENDLATMERELAQAQTGPDGEMGVLNFRSGLAASRGRLQQRNALDEQWIKGALRMKLRELVALDIAGQAIDEALVDNRGRALEHAAAALQLATSRDTVSQAGLALALLGEKTKALQMMEELAARRSYDTILQFVNLPLVKAAIDLRENRPEKALDLLDGAMVYARTEPLVHYERGEALLRLGRGQEAGESFQRILSQRSTTAPDLVHGLAQLGLARAHAQQGNSLRSRTAYQDLFALWKDADPDFPQLKQAQREYAKLQAPGPGHTEVARQRPSSGHRAAS
jgi:tetratricopeptide (TPR) repeat protein